MSFGQHNNGSINNVSEINFREDSNTSKTLANILNNSNLNEVIDNLTIQKKLELLNLLSSNSEWVEDLKLKLQNEILKEL
jgi:hypothetical protein